METVSVSIDSLTLDPRNARRHSERNLRAIQESLSRFGQRKPIVVRGSQVLAGNGTLEAARQLGWTEIRVVEAPADWNEDTAKAYALADNRTAELAEWDEIELGKQLLELERDGWDIEALGFDQRQMEKPEPADEDDIPDTPDEPTSNLGQMWKLGQHRLICGDSTDRKVLETLLEGQLADCIFTDPPYNVAYEGGTKDKLTIQNDAMSEAQFTDFIRRAYEAMYANAKDGCPIYVCHADNAATTFRTTFADAGWMMKQVLIWVKDNFVLSRQDYNWQHEPILYGWKPGAAHPWYGPFNDTTVLEYGPNEIAKMTKEELQAFLTKAINYSTLIRVERPRKNAEHPTMKPVALITRLLSNSAKRGQIILDGFGGGGSTMIAAETLGMKAHLCELDPKYVDVIINRWENYTGQKAELVKEA